MSVQHIPNHDKVVFKDMTPEERSVIVEAWLSDNIEYYSHDLGGWQEKGNSGLYDSTVYRTVQRKLEIPWEHIKPEYKWAAMDESGRVCFFCGQPLCRVRDGMWENGQDWAMSPLAINTTGIDWRESLTARPDGV